ncbi:MAG: IPT/TIG domain-containing protein, partial [Polyangiales bacterium]
MKSLAVFSMMALVVATGCGTSSNAAQDKSGAKSLGEALTTGVMFDHGVVKSGAIPKADPAAQKVHLLAEAAAFAFAPGQSSLMPLDVDNPDQDKNAVMSTLMQFDGSSSHVEVPAKASQTDAGVDQQGVLHLELGFTVSSDICKDLCNRRLASRLLFAVALGDGAVSEHVNRDVELDCTMDGDPKKCSPTGAVKGAGATRDAATSADAGADGGALASTDAGPLRDAATTDGAVDGSSSARSDGGSGVAPPQLAALNPASATAGTALTLSITGTGFAKGAVAYLDEQALSTQVSNDGTLSADVPASATQSSGNLAVYVENVSGDAGTQSNVLYLQVDPEAGAPVVYDYSPDNGVGGDKILIIASNLAGQTLTIKDARGTTLTPGALSTLSWPTVGTADTVEIALPSNIANGPITVSNPMGSFKGKIFSVGTNLTRAAGTTLDSSTQFNDTNWARASGADNSLATSFFTANGDCASMTSCTTKPWYKVTFAADQTVARIAIRGNREYASGYDFLSGEFQVLDASDAVLWEG